MTKLKIESMYVPRLFGKRLYLQKVKLKWPLSRGSHFDIYFRLECWENRGSRQNFHEILFSKDCILINPDHFVTYHLMITCLSNENKQFTLKHGRKKWLRKLINSYQKYDLETTTTIFGFSFFTIFCGFQ